MQEIVVSLLRNSNSGMNAAELYDLLHNLYGTNHTSKNEDAFAGRVIKALSLLEKKGVVLQASSFNPFLPKFTINPMWELINKARTEADIKS